MNKRLREQISRYVRAFIYLVLTSQVQPRASIVGNSAPAVDAQKVFNSIFKELINEDFSIGIDVGRYQGVLEYAISQVDFSVGVGIYMLPSNLNLSIGQTKGYNNKTLVSNTDMKICSNRDTNNTFNCRDWFNCLSFLVGNKWHHCYSQ